MIRIGKSEKIFITEGVSENIRSDGRKRLDFRPFSLKTSVFLNF
jgi:exosome complex RNA-binding protein Rrp42 (RNase PH superfamily)